MEVLELLKIMGWLGIVLAILVIVNTACGIVKNVSEGQPFSWKVLFKGLGKSLLFYVCSVLIAIAFALLPFINDMITTECGVELISGKTLETLSSTAVLGIVITVIITQGKKAIQGIVELINIKISNIDEEEF